MLIPSVAIDQAATDFTSELSYLRQQGYRMTGVLVQRDLQLTRPTTVNGITTCTATYCEDNSSTALVDASNKPVAIPDRAFATTTILTQTPDNTWIVSRLTNEVAQC